MNVRENPPARTEGGTDAKLQPDYDVGSAESNPDEFLKIALGLAGKGRSIFPCKPDKKPFTEHGFKDASTDSETITSWWAQHPGANVGLATGSVNGVVVLDVDVDETKELDGAASLVELTEQNEPLPPTLTVGTPRGGRHHYFQHPGTAVPCSTGKLGTGLDVRADGGYVLLPPSKTDRGAYQYLDRSPIAPLPEWLRELMVNGAAGSSAPDRTPATGKVPTNRPAAPGVPPTVAQLILAGAGEGTRNERGFWIATQLRDEGRDRAAVETYVLQFAGRCQPPLPPGEALKAVASAFNGASRNRRGIRTSHASLGPRRANVLGAMGKARPRRKTRTGRNRIRCRWRCLTCNHSTLHVCLIRSDRG